EPATSTTEYPAEAEALFEIPPAKELSEKLSMAPIRDLRKAMGLNEKIFTINELFGGDKELYENAILMLNELDNFEQAKAYLLENMVLKFGWTTKDKKKKARNFINLVRRRYL
ncbi:MAG: hypothetical protein D6765_16895, partial [Bacteroidetes bacterium]